MCGIAGFYALRAGALPRDDVELEKICESMAHRGPDGHGIWVDPEQRAALGHRRLAIIDLSAAAAEPMFDQAGNLAVVFNGEIYNYQELRKELEAQGCRFRTNSDTEVLLAAFAKYGPAMVGRLRGMFAFVIYDLRRKRVFLTRDPLGIKPLYYSLHGDLFRFASQVKALCAGGKAGNGVNAAAHVGYFLLGHVPDPYTFYSDILSLPAGTSMIVDERGLQGPSTYWSLTEALLEGAERERPPEAERLEVLHGALRNSLKHHLVSDVPVGVFLSSGLDSCTILALASEQSSVRLETFTLGFEEFRGTPDDEVPLAEEFAHELGTKHKSTWVQRSDFLDNLDGIIRAMDQPSVDGVNTYMVSQEGRRAGLKVALSGLGGDELFGGYPSFRQLPFLLRMTRRIPFGQAIGRSLRPIASRALRRLTSPKYAGLLEYGISYPGAYLLRRALYMPWEIEDVIGPRLANEGLEQLDVLRTLEKNIRGLTTPHENILALEATWYMRDQLLRDADWASMAHSIEMRVPFVDHVLIEKISPYLAGPTPYAKKEMALSPQRPLPARVLNRPKTGFSVPVQAWIVDRLRSEAQGDRGLRGWGRYVYARATGQNWH